MQVADKPDELEKRFLEFHHHLGELRDSLFLGDFVNDGANSPCVIAKIIESCPNRARKNERDLTAAQKQPSCAKAVRRFMEMERCYAELGSAIDGLWSSGLEILMDKAKRPMSYEADILESPEKPIGLNFIAESMLDGLGEKEKSRLLAGCARLSTGRSLGEEFSDAERKALSCLTHILTQITPALLDCKKRFSIATELFARESGLAAGDPSHSTVPTVVFGHRSWSPMIRKEAETSNEMAIREYRADAAMPECFLDALDEDLERSVGPLREYLTETSGCGLESIRRALMHGCISDQDNRFNVAQEIQAAYVEIIKYEKALPKLALALYEDFSAHPELYADDLSCHISSGSEFERRYPILELLPRRLRQRLLWGHEHKNAVEGCSMLTGPEKKILRIPGFNSFETAVDNIIPGLFLC